MRLDFGTWVASYPASPAVRFLLMLRTRQLGLRMDISPSSDRLVHNGNIDSAVYACQSESEACSGASTNALFLRVL